MTTIHFALSIHAKCNNVRRTACVISIVFFIVTAHKHKFQEHIDIRFWGTVCIACMYMPVFFCLQSMQINVLNVSVRCINRMGQRNDDRADLACLQLWKF